MPQCASDVCDRPAQPEHTPCCTAHLHPLCCEHYCRRHFIEVRRCSPERHPSTAKEPQP